MAIMKINRRAGLLGLVVAAAALSSQQRDDTEVNVADALSLRSIFPSGRKRVHPLPWNENEDETETLSASQTRREDKDWWLSLPSKKSREQPLPYDPENNMAKVQALPVPLFPKTNWQLKSSAMQTKGLVSNFSTRRKLLSRRRFLGRRGAKVSPSDFQSMRMVWQDQELEDTDKEEATKLSQKAEWQLRSDDELKV